ncbi:MAG TPA: hypothetical protein VGW34_11830 [Allosphingosinicella sp.]|nr:hypothetical protein [Allosphingosinicella sp.]
MDRDAALRISAWALVLLGSLLNLLNHNEYPLLTAEVAAVAAGLVGLAAAFGLLHRLAMPRLSFLFTALLIGLAVDLNSDRFEWVVAAVAAGLVAAWFRDAVVLKLVAAAFLGVTFFQLAQGRLSQAASPPATAPARPAQRPDLAPVVHILFDAYLGIDGMAEEEATFGALRKANVDFFARRGFRLYGGAYSEHRNTANSLPQIFSFGRAPLATVSQRQQRSTPGELAYFKALGGLGYRIHLLQTDYVDLCAGQGVADCRSFRRSDLSAIAGTGMSVGDRAETIASTLTGLAVVPAALFNNGSKAWADLSGGTHLDLQQRGKLFPIASMKAMDELERLLEGAGRGDAYVAHFLIPHDPFLYDGSCRVRPRRDWSFEGMPPSRQLRERDYAAQMRCVLTRLDRLLAALARSPAGKDAIVIVHGDHGSRIADEAPQLGAAPSRRDFAMTYSTLFAVRGPGIPAGYDPGRAPVEHLLGELSRSRFRRPPKAHVADRHVVLTDADWVPRQKVALPPFGGRPD